MRLALYALSARHNLSAQETMRLAELARLQSPIGLPARQLVQGVALLAAALGGFGVIVWLAANWDILGRFARFALLEGAIVAMSLGAIFLSKWRTPLGLGALLCTGGLFAYFGQTYQTGADPWLLFAVWASLTLPLCLSVRSDAVWTPWVLVTMAAIALWTHAHTLSVWGVERTDVNVHLLSWFLSFGLSAALHPRFERWTGAATWAWRLGLVLAVFALSVTAVQALFMTHSPLYVLGLLLLGAVALVLAQRRTGDILGLSATTLGLNVLIDFGLGRFLFKSSGLDWLGAFFWLGVCAAGLLALSVALVLRCHRQSAAVQEGQA